MKNPIITSALRTMNMEKLSNNLQPSGNWNYSAFLTTSIDLYQKIMRSNPTAEPFSFFTKGGVKLYAAKLKSE